MGWKLLAARDNFSKYHGYSHYKSEEAFTAYDDALTRPWNLQQEKEWLVVNNVRKPKNHVSSK